MEMKEQTNFSVYFGVIESAFPPVIVSVIN